VGFVYVDVVIRGSRASKTVRALVDTGSTYVVLSPELVEELGLFETPYSVELILASGERVGAKLYVAEAEVRGRRGPILVAALKTPIPLLGVHSLETLGFKVNPRTGELEEVSPEGGYLL